MEMLCRASLKPSIKVTFEHPSISSSRAQKHLISYRDRNAWSRFFKTKY
jgi:hypothetical protein